MQFPMFQFVPVNFHPATGHHREVSDSIVFTSHINKYSYILISSPRSLILSSCVRYTSPLTIFAALYCTLSISFLPCRSPELDITLQMLNREKISFVLTCWQFFLTLSKAVVCPNGTVQTHVKIVAYLNSGSFCTRLFSKWLALACTYAWGFSCSGKGLGIFLCWIPWDSYWDASKQQYNLLVYQFSSQFYVVSKIASVPSPRPSMKMLNSFVSQN